LHLGKQPVTFWLETDLDWTFAFCRFLPVTTNRFGLFFAIVTVFFEQVHQQENIHAEINEGGQASLEVRLSTAQTSDQQFSVIP
jgi:hypothetical protein